MEPIVREDTVLIARCFGFCLLQYTLLLSVPRLAWLLERGKAFPGIVRSMLYFQYRYGQLSSAVALDRRATTTLLPRCHDFLLSFANSPHFWHTFWSLDGLDKRDGIRKLKVFWLAGGLLFFSFC